MQHQKVFFRFEGIPYNIVLEKAYVFMQGHVVIHGIQDLCEGFCLLIDIGGGTVDMVGIEDGIPNGFYQIDPRATLYFSIVKIQYVLDYPVSCQARFLLKSYHPHL